MWYMLMWTLPAALCQVSPAGKYIINIYITKFQCELEVNSYTAHFEGGLCFIV